MLISVIHFQLIFQWEAASKALLKLCWILLDLYSIILIFFRCIWEELELDDGKFQKLIKALICFGLACELPKSPQDEQEEKKLLIPWFLHSELNPTKKEEVFPSTPDSIVVSTLNCCSYAHDIVSLIFLLCFPVEFWHNVLSWRFVNKMCMSSGQHQKILIGSDIWQSQQRRTSMGKKSLVDQESFPLDIFWRCP